MNKFIKFSVLLTVVLLYGGLLSAQYPPADTCPPVISELMPYPGATDVPRDVEIRFNAREPVGCPASGIDTTTGRLEIWIGDTLWLETYELNYEGYGYYCWVSWFGSSLPPGAHLRACVSISDIAGNPADTCWEFDIEGEPPDTTDIWAPCFVNWIPEPGHLESLAGVRLSVDVCDICEGSE
ncbi:hypothetical protein J7K18_06595, partial [bacterium]|nr:hypothetical protein [bacterium]